MRHYIQPVAEKLGIQERIGWHTFRHTYCILLRSLGVEFKVMQELMRHSSLRSALDVYAQAVGPSKARCSSSSAFAVLPPLDLHADCEMIGLA